MAQAQVSRSFACDRVAEVTAEACEKVRDPVNNYDVNNESTPTTNGSCEVNGESKSFGLLVVE